ncbi:alpha/beta hydrolase [Pseudarthrobacter sp. J64]|uniref:alpha/beta hydrolase n=1 Tax=Pseudarthrobacter sp. J64 TaxID=3116485 RepID=UPI003FA68F99
MKTAPPRGLTVVPAVTPPGSGLPSAAPAVLVLPGGGYERQADHEAEPVAQWLSSLGIHAFVLRYRVAPERHPAPLEDAKTAMLWIRNGGHGLAVDPARVGVLGFSAGGHLAATLSTGVSTGNPGLDVDAAVPALSILCYPVVSFMTGSHQGSVDNLLGPASGALPAERHALMAALSAEQNVHAATPPAFLWHTADDASVPVSNSLGYAAALAEAGVPVELHVFPQGRHGLGLAAAEDGAGQWPALCAAWLRRMAWTG